MEGHTNRRPVIGYLTLAVGLIATGVLIFLFVFHLGRLRWLELIGPSLLIVLGLEWIWAHTRRGDSRQKWSALAIILVVLMCFVSMGGLAVTRAAAYFHVNRQDGRTWFQGAVGPQQEVSFNRILTLNQNIKKVDIEVPNGQVDVVGTSASTMQYRGTFYTKASDNQAAKQTFLSDWSVHSSGDTVTLLLKLPLTHNIFSLVTATHMTLHVTMPKGLMVNVHSTNAISSVQHIDNAVTVTETNGTIAVSDVTGPVVMQTTNGNCRVDGIRGSLRAGSTNGDVTAKDVTKGAQIRTTNGSVSMSSNRVGGNWTLGTTNGDISVSVPKTASMTIHAASDNGGFSGNIPWQMQGHHQANATLGSGQYSATLSTTNGETQASITQ